MYCVLIVRRQQFMNKYTIEWLSTEKKEFGVTVNKRNTLHSLRFQHIDI